MRLATLSAILGVWIVATAQAETLNPQHNNPSLTFHVKATQTEATQGLKAHPAPAVLTKSPTPEIPKFGFVSSFGWQNNSLGQRVTGVQFGGLANRLELKPGDMIVGVNGQELRTAEGWQNAIQRAADQDGWVTLKVLDGRSGRMAYRTANLFQANDR
jgi:S1-C subfamily serine protease